MLLSTSEKMLAADAYAINTLGIPGSLLMRTAAGFVADAAMEFIGENLTAAVFCGSGNNGGDGIAAAAFLITRGVKTRVFLVGRREKMTPDSVEMERRLNEVGGYIEDFDSSDADTAEFVRSAGVIIDAMFGIGLHSALRGKALEAVTLINSSPAPVVAADIASGVRADTGEVLGDAVKADVTVTFSLAKPGHFSEPGCLYTGRLIVKDIGIPDDVLRNAVCEVSAVTESDISLPVRQRTAHKGDFGRCLIVAGSADYTGAPILASHAAVRSGAGLVILAVPESIYDITASRAFEEMPLRLPCGENGLLSENAFSHIEAKLDSADVCLIGPGLGRCAGASALVMRIIENAKCPIVIDADGINAVAENIDILKRAAVPPILTPHVGEFLRLGGDLAAGRIEAARSFAKKYRCVLVLKGHRTVTATPDGRVFINTTGNPGMAKGGSGDVLAGMTASLVGQLGDTVRAAVSAVFLHGKAGDLCSERFGEYCMTPSDIIYALPDTFKQYVR